MAGRIRQPIDIKSLENYLNTHVPEIKTPLDVKQVGAQVASQTASMFTNTDEATTVRIWPEQPNIPLEVCR